MARSARGESGQIDCFARCLPDLNFAWRGTCGAVAAPQSCARQCRLPWNRSGIEKSGGQEAGAIA
eukprot:CAMPEP_0171098088 /NCGR_PEP_ID=MMETSP0766_2-20121228/47929_1 /TAXON_ID=439317 /ORGANISM="Gambierdiscus australes, Strain CAWD 149" /LENGTH=64 /DNA_ID=CAMNT_0011557389 /DNA_START=80 /DNA_END=271 /DNA_ORIENTATION=-